MSSGHEFRKVMVLRNYLFVGMSRDMWRDYRSRVDLFGTENLQEDLIEVHDITGSKTW